MITADSSSVWKALNDQTRRDILDLLRKQPHTTGDLSACFTGLTRFAVMKHLNVLLHAGLIITKKQGRERWHYLNAIPLQLIYERWMRPYESMWAQSLIGIARSAEEETTMPDEKKLQSIRVEQEIVIAASPDKVFHAMVEDTGSWWGMPYLRNPESSKLVIEARLGGLMYESWGNDNEGAECARVTTYKENEILELNGRFGLDGAVVSVARFELRAEGDKTFLSLSHHIIGEIDNQTKEQYSFGWRDLIGTRLKAFVEQGECYGIGHPPPPGFSLPDNG